MNKLDRSSSIEIANSRFASSTHFDNREWCRSEDVERLEFDYAELEASHAELLAAAKQAVWVWSDESIGGPEQFDNQIKACDRLRAAIAKAEGEVMA